MSLAVHLMAAAMGAVLLAPLWLFLGLRLAARLARRRGGADGWLAQAGGLLDDDGGRAVPVKVEGAGRGPAPGRTRP